MDRIFNICICQIRLFYDIGSNSYAYLSFYTKNQKRNIICVIGKSTAGARAIIRDRNRHNPITNSLHFLSIVKILLYFKASNISDIFIPYKRGQTWYSGFDS